MKKINNLITKTFAAVLAFGAMCFTCCTSGLIDGKKDAVVRFSVNKEESRTVNPDVEAVDLTAITVTYKPSSAGAETEAVTLVSGKNYDELTAGSYAMKEGEYTFSAAACINEMNYTASKTVSLSADGTNTVALTFSKTTAGTAVEGKGDIKITFTLEDTSVNGVKAVLQNADDSSVKIAEAALTISDRKFEYTASDVDSGNYRLAVDFYSDAACTVKTGTYRELVNVSKGFTSRAERTIKDASTDVYTVTYHLDDGITAAGVTLPETVSRFTEYTLPDEDEITKQYAIFLGWYTDADFTNKITELKNVTGNLNLYARWIYCLTFKGNGAFTLGIDTDSGVRTWETCGGTLEYSTDKYNWTKWDESHEPGEAVESDGSWYTYLRGSGITSFCDASYNLTAFKFTAADAETKVECNGNIMSLLDYKNPDAAVMGDNCFMYLFSSNTLLTKAPELPAETLSDGCYTCMFYDCSALETAPALNSKNLAHSCYSYMFNGCSSLKSVQTELPATDLADSCYSNMFKGCTSLETAPALPAVILTSSCYCSMFDGCSKLKAVPELPATTLASSCYTSMFNGCTTIETAPALPVENLESNCYQYMYQGCTSLTATPELPATTLVSSCYHQMFDGCTGIKSIGKISATDITVSALASMFAESGLYIVKTDASDPDCFITLETIGSSKYTQKMFYNCIFDTGVDLTTPTVGSYKLGTREEIDGTVTISGKNVIGETLTATYSGNAEPSVTYQWYADDTAISGATSSTYKLTGSEYGKKIKVIVSGSSTYTGSITSLETGEVTKITLYGSAIIIGNLQAGETLNGSCIMGGTGQTFSYQWLSGNDTDGYTDIPGATGSTYTLTSNEVGKKIKLTLTGIGDYTGSITSVASDEVTEE